MSLFFELLQLSFGTLEKLSRVPNAREWEEVYEMSGQQAVTGILLTGQEKLPAENLPPLELKLQWIGERQITEQQNFILDKRCVELLGILENAGLRGSILKGQGIASLYDEELRCGRQPGDIDIYVDCGLEKALAFARSLGQKNISWDYKHLHLNLWEDTEVELHYRVEFVFNLFKNKKLQRWFGYKRNELYESNPETGFVTPSVRFNVFYILLHIYQHYFSEGVGMRQIVDYYFVLKEAYRLKLTAGSELEAVKIYGLERFAKGLMWVMKEALGMPQEWMLWEPDEKEGRFILAQVMEGGNFGQYVEGYRPGLKWNYVWNVCRRNMHLLRWYPSEALWAPVWIVWHKAWKICKRWQLRAYLTELKKLT